MSTELKDKFHGIFSDASSKMVANVEYSMHEIERLAGIEVKAYCISQYKIASSVNQMVMTAELTLAVVDAPEPVYKEGIAAFDKLHDTISALQPLSAQVAIQALVPDRAKATQVYNILASLIRRDYEMFMDTLANGVELALSSKKEG